MFTGFIDLTKAFDTVNQNEAWKILGKLACPPKFLTIVWEVHVG